MVKLDIYDKLFKTKRIGTENLILLGKLRY